MKTTEKNLIDSNLVQQILIALVISSAFSYLWFGEIPRIYLQDLSSLTLDELTQINFFELAKTMFSFACLILVLKTVLQLACGFTEQTDALTKYMDDVLEKNMNIEGVFNLIIKVLQYWVSLLAMYCILIAYVAVKDANVSSDMNVAYAVYTYFGYIFIIKTLVRAYFKYANGKKLLKTKPQMGFPQTGFVSNDPMNRSKITNKKRNGDRSMRHYTKIQSGDILLINSVHQNCGMDRTVFTGLVVETKKDGLVVFPQDFIGYMERSKRAGVHPTGISIEWLADEIDMGTEVSLIYRSDEGPCCHTIGSEKE